MAVAAKTLIALMRLGGAVEHLDERLEVLADSYALDEGQSTSLGIGPNCLLSLIEAMNGKSSLLTDTIPNPSFGITLLSASKIKKQPPRINNFTYIKLNQTNKNL